MEKKAPSDGDRPVSDGSYLYWTAFGLSYKTYQKIDAADQKMTSVIEPVKTKQKAMKEDIDLYTAKIEKKQATDKYLRQRSQTEQAVKNNTGEHERAPESENSQKSSKPSVFSEAGGEDSLTEAAIPLLLLQMVTS